MAAFVPTDLTDFVIATLQAGVTATTLPANSRVRHYAGEFLDEDQLKRLTAEVEQHHHFMVDFETIQAVTDRAGENNAWQLEPRDVFIVVVYSAASSLFSESLQWQTSYTGAWNARRVLQGVEFEAESGIVSAGKFIARDIEREFHIPGLSVHTLRVEIELVTNTQAE